MKEIMYNHSSLAIVAILYVLLVVAIESAFYFGMRQRDSTSEALRSQINAIQASLLGVLALLLGFTLSLSLQRFDARSVAVVEEANAIGTSWLRTDLLPDSVRSEAKDLFRQYIIVRIAAGEESLDRVDRRDVLGAQAEGLQARLWNAAVAGTREDPNNATTGLFTQSLNAMIDEYSARQATLDRHVPEVVLFMLLGTLLLACALVGYVSGIAGQRAPFATYVLVTLIVLLVFIIIDLDRPRRGLIEVRQDNMLELRDAIVGAADVADADSR